MRAALAPIALALAACAAPTSDAAMPCETLFDFADADDLAAWSVQNDTVMGGNSQGAMADAGALLFEGNLVTRGGGFVQVNAPLPDGALTGAKSLRVVGASDGRPWRVRIETDQRVPRAEARGGEAGSRVITRSGPDMDGPRVAFSAPIEGWDTGTESDIGTADLIAPDASMRGRPVRGATWNPSEARSLGLILADGRDAPFALRVERIEVCR